MKTNTKNTSSYSYFKVILLAAISAGLMALCFPNTNYYFFSFFGLVPLTLVLMTQKKQQALLAMFVFVVIYFGWLMSWVTYFHFAAYPGTLLGVFIMYAIATLIYQKLIYYFPRSSVIFLPMVFTSLEYLRTIGFLRFPYGNIGYALVNSTEMSQVAEWTGHLGLSFLLYLINGLLAYQIIRLKANPWKLKSKKELKNTGRLLFPTFVIIFILMGVYFLGKSRLPTDDASESTKMKKVKVALVQPWFDYNQPWNEENRKLMMHKLFTLSRLAKPYQPDIIIWPETALLSYYEFRLKLGVKNVINYRDFFTNFNNKEPKTHFLIGTLDQDRPSGPPPQSIPKDGATAKGMKTASASKKIKIYNTALLLDRLGNIQERYSKQLLVPFAEWFPYSDFFIFKYLTFVKKILEQASASQFSPGTEKTLFSHPLFKFSVLICYEDCFGDFTRRFVKKGAMILVVLTNDAWSYSEKSERLHNLFSRFRAIENRKVVVRATNGGITCIIDPYGRITKSLTPFKESLLLSEVDLHEEKTFYTQFGNFFYKILTILTLGLFLGGFLYHRLIKKV